MSAQGAPVRRRQKMPFRSGDRPHAQPHAPSSAEAARSPTTRNPSSQSEPTESPRSKSVKQIALSQGTPFMGTQPRCLVLECDGVCLSSSEREALWGRFYTGAPRPRTPFERSYSDRKLRPRNWHRRMKAPACPRELNLQRQLEMPAHAIERRDKNNNVINSLHHFWQIFAEIQSSR